MAVRFLSSENIDGVLTFSTTGTFGNNASITHYTNNYLYIRGGSAGLVVGDNTSATRALFSSSNFITWEVNNVAAMHIDSSGRVGIGTTSPSQKLTVVGNAYVSSGVLLLDNNYAIQWGDSNEKIKGHNTDGLIFETDGSERMRIDNANNTNVSIKAKSGTAGNEASLSLWGTNTSGFGSSLIAQSRIDSLTDGTAYGSIMRFYTNNTSNTLTERMRITSGGNVGIGTTSPSDLLHLKKSSGDAALRIETVTGGDPTIYFNSAAANRSGLIRYQDNGTNMGRIEYVHNGDRIAFQAGSATGETMSIKNNAVGIGTTSPVQPLHVNGQVLFRTTTVDGGKNRFQLIPGGSSDAANLYLYYGNAGDGTVSVRLNAQGDSYLNGGNVGIGTTTMQGKLTVVGTTQTIVADLDANTAVGLSVMGVDSNNFNAITVGAANSTNNCGVARFKYVGAGSTNNYMGLGFYANDDILTVKANGRVGINQNNPGSELHVEGNGGDGLAMLRLVAATTGGTFNWASSTVYPNIGTGKTIINLFGHAQSQNNQAYIGFKYAGSGSTSNQLTFGFYANDFLVNLLANGNFGIGTQSPSTKLDVRGGAGGGSFDHATFTSVTNRGLKISTANSSEGQNGAAVIYNAQDAENYGSHAFQIGGSTKMLIHSTGRVSIGSTTASANTLTLSGTATEMDITNTSTNGRSYRIESDSAGLFVIKDRTANADRIVLNSSGNVGIGTTSPNASLEISSPNTSGQISLHLNNSSTPDHGNVLAISRRGTDFTLNDSSLVMYSKQNSFGTYEAAHFRARGYKFQKHDGTDYLAINDSGNVGIGNTSPDATLEIGTPSGVAGSAGSVNRLFIAPFSNTGGPYKFIARTVSGSSDFLDMYYGSNHIISYGLDGKVGIGTTSPNSKLYVKGSSSVVAGRFWGEAGTVAPLELAQNSGGGFLAKFYSDTFSTVCGSISHSGSATAFNTSSDYRLKENVVEMTGALDRINQLQPSRFNFIGHEETVDGFLAHEVSNVVPEAITGTKDEVDEEGNPVYQGIDQSKLVPLLVGAIKELKAEIENLKSQIQ